MSSVDSAASHAVPLEGRLSDPATLPRLLAWLGRGEWSGMIVLRADGIERRLYLADGRLSTAGSSDTSDALASCLIRAGLLSDEDRSRAAGQLRTTDRGWAFGRQLVKLGLLTDLDLSRTERRRVLGIAQAALGLRSGQYSCESGAVAGDAMPNQGIEIPRVVAEGVLMTWEPNSALDVLGGRNALLDIITETLSDYEATGAAEEYDAALLRCNGRRSVQEILDMSPLPEAAALRFLAAMRLIGCIATAPGPAAAAYDPEATVPSEHGRSAGGDDALAPSAHEGGFDPDHAHAALHDDDEHADESAVPVAVDFEAARAEEVAAPGAARSAGRGAPWRKEQRPAKPGENSPAVALARGAKADAAATASTSRWGMIIVAVIALALLVGAGFVAWRGWVEMQATSAVESP